ncbi:hypothetical protein FB567DRAFT_308839 [Paraphoma chrysanthemicola]|uniref:ChrR-like cupin domain-containing protein n=1 Tax=Paraphoma chrysanthemicola TaxID=798071 RepID=A0A8K0W0V9_9PLEO|nr:hypothetical protein FB567DRAFT_308839 [Paraphoma chrysanthemicola]
MQQYEFHAPQIDPLTNTPRQCTLAPTATPQLLTIVSSSNPDITISNLTKKPGQNLEPGISQLTLNHDPSTGRATYLQRWSPRTSNQIQNFSHAYIEEIVIIEGDLTDLKGRRSGTGEIIADAGEEGEGRGDVWKRGAYAYRKPGMDHGPFRSEEGCLMFIVVIPAGVGGS